MQWLFAAVFIIAGVVVYFPLMFIRKMNKVMAVLEKIEKNTATAERAMAAGAGKVA
jgi:hypothetical protein